MPLRALTSRDVDPAEIAFTDVPAPVYQHYSDVQRNGGSNDGVSPVFLGYKLEESWQDRLLYLSRIVNDVTINLVVKTEFYGSTGSIPRFGDMPEQLRDDSVSGLRFSEEEAREMADDSRRVVLSQLGFLSWLLSVLPNWESLVEDSDGNFVHSLQLEERGRRGIVFDLRRDRHEFNVRHLLDNEVPFHYCWTEAESQDACYFRWSPDYTTAHDVVAYGFPNGPIDMTHIPSYDDWRENLQRFDVFLQDIRFGQVGRTLNRFMPQWSYYIVDFHHYGARIITDAYTRRAYSERFRGMIKESSCTFYR
ncbi:hypothetical protein K438DRAFT_1996076 [Mycena galopus ATCC 62051]|nr:hypothetical protein K438DRAFT_1996076 [Mycena galopus ATCC 62051]